MPQNISLETAYQKRQAAQFPPITPTSKGTIERYRHTRNWQLNRKEFIFRKIHEFGPSNICDFGCGAGETSTELGVLGYHVTGLDLSVDLIALARRRAELDNVADRVQFIVSDANHADLSRDSFDLILVQGVLHHMEIDHASNTLFSMLKPGGHVIISEPIMLSPTLRWIRKHIPVSLDLSPNERQLGWDDIRLVESRFNLVERRFFHLSTRLIRLISDQRAIHGHLSHLLARLDHAMIRAIPGMYRLAGILVFIGQKPITA